jgi:uncharacterized protein (DUF2141 family)
VENAPPVCATKGDGDWMKALQCLSALACGLYLASPWSSAARGDAASMIHADIAGLRNDKGQVLCDLYSSAGAFPGKPEDANARVIAAISQGRAFCEFRNLLPGRYAISVVHDENKNGRLDRLLGMPREGVGASRDARGHLGPPKFDDAAFDYRGSTLNLSITMVYLL